MKNSSNERLSIAEQRRRDNFSREHVCLMREIDERKRGLRGFMRENMIPVSKHGIESIIKSNMLVGFDCKSVSGYKRNVMDKIDIYKFDVMPVKISSGDSKVEECHLHLNKNIFIREGNSFFFGESFIFKEEKGVYSVFIFGKLAYKLFVKGFEPKFLDDDYVDIVRCVKFEIKENFYNVNVNEEEHGVYNLKNTGWGGVYYNDKGYNVESSKSWNTSSETHSSYQRRD